MYKRKRKKHERYVKQPKILGKTKQKYSSSTNGAQNKSKNIKNTIANNLFYCYD